MPNKKMEELSTMKKFYVFRDNLLFEHKKVLSDIALGGIANTNKFMIQKQTNRLAVYSQIKGYLDCLYNMNEINEVMYKIEMKEVKDKLGIK